MDKHYPGMGTLTSVQESSITIIKGGISIRAESLGKSLIVLPVQYSHCFNLPPLSSAKLIRVNLVQVGILFDKIVDLKMYYSKWPFASVKCQREDYMDSARLLTNFLH